MIRHLRIKFVCINMTIVTVMLCVIFGLILHFTGESIKEESIDMMQSVALQPHQPGVPGQNAQGVYLPYFTLQVAPDGEVLASGSGYFDLTDQVLLEKLIALSSSRKSGVLKDYGLRYIRVTTPGAQCIVFADMSGEINTISSLLQNCLLIGAISFFAFLLISILLAHWAVKPVELAWKQQQQFVADASHELKTPLSVILSNTQMLSTQGDDPHLREKLTENLVSVAEQMGTLVERLLHAARVDQGAESMSFSAVNWSETVSGALLPFDPVFFERELTLESDIREGITVRGSEAHLAQVVDILLDNARKYSVERGRTRVELRRQGKRHCLLSVSNEGIPFSAQEAKDIFKRFYRLDAARERSGSYGLGLSIAEGIVRAHRGKIWAESGDGVNTFFVQLPTITE